MLSEKHREIARQTAAVTERVFADMRRMRLEGEMTGRIRKAWEQLDGATDEIVRLSETIQAAKANSDWETVRTFDRDLALEKAKALGKAEILALIMPAPLNTPKAIGQEAGKRYQARRAGVKYETPGLRMVAAAVLDDVGDGTERFS